MKKIYFSLLLIAGALQISNAQLTLTKAVNEPVIGDVFNKQFYDSTTSVPKATGAGMNWDFTSLVANSNLETSTYVSVASTPSAASFPGATISEAKGSPGNYTHYKSTATTFEYQGVQFPGSVTNFTNTGILYTWPVGFGYTASDSFGGAGTTTITGSENMSGTGTGTVVMPNNLILTNCLQTVFSLTVNLASASFSQTQVSKEYSYYHSSNKYPLIIIKYQTTTSGTVVTKGYEVRVNTAIVAGLTSFEITNNQLVYPNPTSDMITVSLENKSNEAVNLSLSNSLGQTVRTENLGNDQSIQSNLNVNDLPKGIYFLKTTIGKMSSVKKIVIQ
jgi:hypothetical protein